MSAIFIIFLVVYLIWVFGGFATRSTYPLFGYGLLAVLLLLIILKLFGVI